VRQQPNPLTYKRSPQGARANRAGKQSRQTNRGGTAARERSSSSLRGSSRGQGKRGRRAGRVQHPILATQVVGIAHPGDILTMVTTCGKAVARRSVGTQTEAPRKDTSVQVSGCRECLSLALVPEDSRDNSCVRCEQVNELLSLVAELKEEVERLRSIQECESEIDRWSRTLPSLMPRQQEAAPRKAENPLPSCHRAERGT